MVVLVAVDKAGSCSSGGVVTFRILGIDYYNACNAELCKKQYSKKYR